MFPKRGDGISGTSVQHKYAANKSVLYCLELLEFGSREVEEEVITIIKVGKDVRRSNDDGNIERD